MKLFTLIALTFSLSTSAQSLDDAYYLVDLSSMTSGETVQSINYKYEAVSYFTEGEHHIFMVPGMSYVISKPFDYPYNMVTIIHKDLESHIELIKTLRSMAEFIESDMQLMENGAESYRFESDWCVIALLFDYTEGDYAITAFKKDA